MLSHSHVLTHLVSARTLQGRFSWLLYTYEETEAQSWGKNGLRLHSYEGWNWPFDRAQKCLSLALSSGMRMNPGWSWVRDKHAYQVPCPLVVLDFQEITLWWGNGPKEGPISQPCLSTSGSFIVSFRFLPCSHSPFSIIGSVSPENTLSNCILQDVQIQHFIQNWTQHQVGLISWCHECDTGLGLIPDFSLSPTTGFLGGSGQVFSLCS